VEPISETGRSSRGARSLSSQQILDRTRRGRINVLLRK
jgi:hypothetical protein